MKLVSSFCLGVVAMALCFGMRSQAAVFDLSRDFSTNFNAVSNPAWKYGYKTNLQGTFFPFTSALTQSGANGVPLQSMSKNNSEPADIFYNATTNTATSSGATYPPGTVWYHAGVEGHPDNYGAIRFTVPTNGGAAFKLEAAVRDYLDGASSADADFHIVVNGVEIFAQFLPANAGTGYTNTLSLASGDNVDFLVGRGADGLINNSGLKIQVTLTSPLAYDVSRDFLTNSNPSGPWAYGYKTTLTGPFSLVSTRATGSTDNGVLLQIWNYGGAYPLFLFNGTTSTGTVHSSHGAPGAFEPGTLAYSAGNNGQPQNFGAIRFTVPTNCSGNYHLETSVQSLYADNVSGDTDFHVVINGLEVFGLFLNPNSGTGYTNAFDFVAGDTIDFLVGRGADASLNDSQVKIKASFTFLQLTYRLLNIDFGVGSNKVGMAATGQSGLDYWNRYNKQPVPNGLATNLLWADGVTSSVTVGATNAPGYFSTSTGDPMYDSYIYSSGSIGITLSNLPPGLTDFYIYGHGSSDDQNGVYQIASGTNVYSARQTTITPAWNSIVWQENTQYVVFRGVSVAFGQPVVVIASPGLSTLSLVNGMQIVSPLPAITIFPNGGYFTNLTNIVLTTSVSNSVIRYTLDGSVPTASSLQYSNAIIITNGVVLQAQAFNGSAPASEIASATFSRVYALPGDGIPASWRIQYFGTNYLTDSRVGADADPDGDGMTNLQEYQAGTDPTNAASVLRITSLKLMPVITWSSVIGINYQVERQYLNSTNWFQLLPTVRATNSSSVYVDLTTTNSQTIYRIQVIP